MNPGPPARPQAGHSVPATGPAPGGLRPAAEPAGSTRVFRAVVVDDTPDLRALLSLVLDRAPDFRVVGEAGDGREGLEVVGRERPDLVLLDLAMPVMSGLEALPQMRASLPGAAIVVLSGFGSESVASRALDAGADAYVEKGTPAARILDRIREVVGTQARVPPAPESDEVPAAAQTAGAGDPGRADANGDDPADPGPGPEAGPDGATTAGVAVAPSAPGEVARLNEEVRLLRRAVATTAHEIRNPMVVLQWALEALSGEDEELPSDRRDDLVASAHRKLRQLDAMCADLLTAAHAERDEVELALERFDLERLLADLVAEHPGVTLVCPDAAPLPVRADRSRLEQVVTNLLTNAARYGEPPIEVHAMAGPAGRTTISVMDRGPGVPAGFQPRLFGEFARADTSAKVGGNGLGLYVVARLAEAHGGRARYDDRPHGGAMFTFDVESAD